MCKIDFPTITLTLIIKGNPHLFILSVKQLFCPGILHKRVLIQDSQDDRQFLDALSFSKHNISGMTMPINFPISSTEVYTYTHVWVFTYNRQLLQQDATHMLNVQEHFIDMKQNVITIAP